MSPFTAILSPDPYPPEPDPCIVDCDWHGPTEEDEVRLRWTCFNAVSGPKWRGTEIYEPDECETEFDTVIPLENWQERCYTTFCPRCRSELSISMDEPHLLDQQTY